MRHRRKGRVLGRCPSHQRALLRNLASALFLSDQPREIDTNQPKVRGRIVTTLQKAKEVRPVVEKAITVAIRSLEHQRAAEPFAASALRGTEAWRAWRNSDRWRSWAQAMGPVVAARRQALTMLGNKRAVAILFENVATRFEDRPGGYTRILRLAKPRLGDNGTRAIIEFVGVHDRRPVRSPAPAFESTDAGGSAGKDETS